eukprot:4699557-Pleurochrysis_carterae.AAC.1
MQPQLRTREQPTGVTPTPKRAEVPGETQHPGKFHGVRGGGGARGRRSLGGREFGGSWRRREHRLLAPLRIGRPALAIPARAGRPRTRGGGRGHVRTVRLCAEVQKYTTLTMASRMQPYATALIAARCTHGTAHHPAVAYGRDAQGAPRARATAAYCVEMNRAIAEAFLRAWGGAGARKRAVRAAPEATGGRVANGPSLSNSVRARVEEARFAPPAFASLRNKAPAETSALADEPMPGDLWTP